MYKTFSFQNIIHWKRKLITPQNVDVEHKENWELKKSLLLLLQFAEASGPSRRNRDFGASNYRFADGTAWLMEFFRMSVRERYREVNLNHLLHHHFWSVSRVTMCENKFGGGKLSSLEIYSNVSWDLMKVEINIICSSLQASLFILVKIPEFQSLDLELDFQDP